MAGVARAEEVDATTSTSESPAAATRLESPHKSGSDGKGGDEGSREAGGAVITGPSTTSLPAINSTEEEVGDVQQYDDDVKESEARTSSCKPSSDSSGEIAAEVGVDGSGSANAENVGSRNEAWYDAIEGKDCKTLLEILKGTPTEGRRALCREKGEEGRTVLHVACMQGCFPLVQQVLDDTGGLLHFADDGRSGFYCWEIARGIGNRSIREYFYRCIFKTNNSVNYRVVQESEWNIALGEGDCALLRKLLSWNSRYLLETCSDGRELGITVLDVAITKNDMELVQVVVDAFKPHGKICWGDSYYPSELSWEWMIQRRHPKRSPPLEIAKKLGRRAILKVLVHPGFDDAQQVAEKASNPREYERLSHLNSFISGCWRNEWDEGFDADVDYNFEEDDLRRELQRFHYVCKDLNKFTTFVDKMRDHRSGWEESQLEKAIESLGMLHDAQGRTPFHIVLEYFKDGDYHGWMIQLLKLGPGRSWHDFVRARDSMGRSPLMTAITNQYLEKRTKLSNFVVDLYKSTRQMLKTSSEEHKLKTSSEEQLLVSYSRVLNLAVYLEDRHTIHQSILEGELSYSSNQSTTPPLLVAAALGNQAIVQMLLKAKFYPMVVDKGGRTALHYAADLTLLKFNPSLKRFCSTEDCKRVKRKWKSEREKKNKLETESNDNSNVGRKACILMLLQVGVDLSQGDKNGDTPDPGTTNDVAFQRWWYDIIVKDTIDQKNSFNQAGNALSVVGTLVAGTSYIGPLQPPLSYSATGYVDTNEVLIRMFMVTNTLAFYLAIASVMFAVVPSLPMPQEGVMDELRRARHTVSFSLCLLLASIVCVTASFASATAVVMGNDQSLHYYSLVFSPSIIGWAFCLIAMGSFFIRVMRLIFYKNKKVRHIYQFSWSDYCKRRWKDLSIYYKRRWKDLSMYCKYRNDDDEYSTSDSDDDDASS